MTIAQRKAALRKALEARRTEAFAGDPDAGKKLASQFPHARVPVGGKIVSGYVQFRSEIDPAHLMADLASRGAVLALPRTPLRGADAPLTFHRVSPETALQRSPFGVLEPPAETEQLAPDIVLAPLLGFDRMGGRLGYGQGHYDRTLAGLRAHKPVIAIGVAFQEQELDHVPQTEIDSLLDWVLTPGEALRMPGRA